MRILPSFFILATLAAGSAWAVPITPGQTYRGKIKLEAPDEGVSFVLPAGWSGGVPAESEYFIMKSTGKYGAIYAGVREFTLKEAKATMSARIPLDASVVLAPQGQIKAAKNRLSGRYTVVGTQLVGVVETVVGPAGTGVVIVGVGKPADRLGVTVEAIANSVRISKPEPHATAPMSAQDKKWHKQLVGKKMTRFFTGSGYSETQVMWLCQNGRFYRKFDSGGVTPGMASGATQSQYRGSWAILKGRLMLAYDDRSTGSYALGYDRKGTPRSTASAGTAKSRTVSSQVANAGSLAKC